MKKEKRFILPIIYKAKLEAIVNKDEQEQLRNITDEVKITSFSGRCKVQNDGHLIIK